MDKFDARQAALDLVTAFVNNNSLQAAELPPLLSDVYAAIAGFGETKVGEVQQADGPRSSPEVLSAAPEPEPEPIVDDKDDNPAANVSIEQSLSDPNYIISMITGEKLKTLSRHLRRHGLDAQQYRARYNLPDDYPMVAPAYSEFRRDVAKKMALGQVRRTMAVPAPAASSDAPVSASTNNVAVTVEEALRAIPPVVEPSAAKPARKTRRNGAAAKSSKARKPVAPAPLPTSEGVAGPDVLSEAEAMAVPTPTVTISAAPARAKRPGRPARKEKGAVGTRKSDVDAAAPAKKRRSKLKPVFDA